MIEGPNFRKEGEHNSQHYNLNPRNRVNNGESGITLSYSKPHTRKFYLIYDVGECLSLCLHMVSCVSGKPAHTLNSHRAPGRSIRPRTPPLQQRFLLTLALPGLAALLPSSQVPPSRLDASLDVNQAVRYFSVYMPYPAGPRRPWRLSIQGLRNLVYNTIRIPSI